MLSDRLDEMNRKSSIHKNLIKWWDINMISPDMEADDDTTNEFDEINNELDYETDVYTSNGIVKDIDDSVDFNELDDNSKDLALKILVENDKSNAYDKAYFSMEVDSFESPEIDPNEIYERLMREAAEDEAKKQKEIEDAKLLANN